MLTDRTRASLVQLLDALPPEAVRLLLLKHLDQDFWPINTHDLLDITHVAPPEALAGLLVELVGGSTAIRANAPTKYVFDGRLADLRGNLRADQFDVVEDALVRLLPAAEPASQIADRLEQVLAGCDIDADGEVRRILRESRDSIAAIPPDFNDGTTKARIALETVARRSAASVASLRQRPSLSDSWGPALGFLRAEGVITQPEEDALAKVYTLLSPGAHVPKGLTDEQWALLARTFAVSGAYFLIHQYLAAL